jgi:hypothetical protein
MRIRTFFATLAVAASTSVFADGLGTLGVVTVVNSLVNGTVPGASKDPDPAATLAELQKESAVIMSRTDLPLLTREAQRMTLVDKFRRLGGIGIFPRYSAQVPEEYKLESMESVGLTTPPPEEVAPEVVRVEPGAFLFSKDAGKSVFVEFHGSPRVAREISAALSRAGLNVVGSAKDAEVVYLFEGGFYVQGASNHKGAEMDAGALLDGADFVVPKDDFFSAPGVQNDGDHYRQRAILIVTRKVVGAADEISVSLVTARSNRILSSGMLDMALSNLLGMSGLLVRVSGDGLLEPGEGRLPGAGG